MRLGRVVAETDRGADIANVLGGAETQMNLVQLA
jgi:hypothetical protein